MIKIEKIRQARDNQDLDEERHKCLSGRQAFFIDRKTKGQNKEAAANLAQSREAHATRAQRQAAFSARKHQPGQGQIESTGVIKTEPSDSNEQESMIPRAAGFFASPGEGGDMVEGKGLRGHIGARNGRGSVTGEGVQVKEVEGSSRCGAWSRDMCQVHHGLP